MSTSNRKKSNRLLKRWKKYLSDSRLSEGEIYRRAIKFTREGKKHMTDLIPRLSKLDAPDREVDAEIDRAFGLLVDIYPLSGPMTDYPEPVGYTETRHYTASIDAAIALAERVLPGWYWGITQGDDGEDAMEFQGNVWPSVQPYPAELEQYGYHKLPAVSLLIALLRAKEASKL